MSKKKPSKTSLRRRARAERPPAAQPDAYAKEILAALNGAGAPLTPDELAERLDIRGRERRSFDGAVAGLERSGAVVKNRAGSLLVATRIALLVGLVV